MPRFAPLLAVLSLSCTGERSSVDIDAYLEATRLVERDPAAAAAACRHVGGMAGDECTAHAAAALAKSDPDAAFVWCHQLEDLSPWRAECGFLVTESAVAAWGPARAAPYCFESQYFALQCLAHVWKAEAWRIKREALSPEASAAAYAPARRWADGATKDDVPDLDHKFWTVFFSAMQYDDLAEAGAPAPFDSAACAAYGRDAGRWCDRVLPALLQRALNRAEQPPNARADESTLCDATGSPQSRVSTALSVRYAPSPALDAITRAWLERRCARRETAP